MIRAMFYFYLIRFALSDEKAGMTNRFCLNPPRMSSHGIQISHCPQYKLYNTKMVLWGLQRLRLCVFPSCDLQLRIDSHFASQLDTQMSHSHSEVCSVESRELPCIADLPADQSFTVEVSRCYYSARLLFSFGVQRPFGPDLSPKHAICIASVMSALITPEIAFFYSIFRDLNGNCPMTLSCYRIHLYIYWSSSGQDNGKLRGSVNVKKWYVYNFLFKTE